MDRIWIRRIALLFALAMCSHAESAMERGPSDAYGGGGIGGQTAAPGQVKEIYHIPVDIAKGPFAADWKSFTADKLKPEPDWWRDAKIGVWFHWGPQSMGRNGDWYARFLYQQQGGRAGRANNITMNNAHLKRFGHPSEFGYMDVLHAWKAQEFDPKKLMDLYAACGARYILVQGAHHDNFDLWNSKGAYVVYKQKEACNLLKANEKQVCEKGAHFRARIPYAFEMLRRGSAGIGHEPVAWYELPHGTPFLFAIEKSHSA